MAKIDKTVSVPQVIGDFGQDDAFATESNPEGLRYGEAPHAPGCLPHPPKTAVLPPEHGEISIG
jgi:hypothetical protein